MVNINYIIFILYILWLLLQTLIFIFMKTGIYKIKNTINNKAYIGSAINIDLRWKEHLNDLKGNKHHSIKLQRAYSKYGKDVFSFEIIEECDITLLIIKEQEHINNFNTYHDGYNCTPTAGSRLGSTQSIKTKDKIRNKLKGRVSPRKGVKISDVTKKKMSKSHTGKVLSDTHIKNISESKKGIKNPFFGKKVKEENKQYKKIKQYTQEGIFIKEWNSLTECAKSLNTTISCISNVLTGNRKTHLKFVFKYSEQ